MAKRGIPKGSPSPNPAGKPRIKIDYAKVEQYAALGLSEEHVAQCIGISSNTFRLNKHRDEEFLAAFERGRSKAIADAAADLLKHRKRGNMAAIIFFLKTRAGWKETSVIETKKPVDMDNIVTPEDAEKAYYETVRQPQQ